MTREEAIKILKDCELNPCVPQDKEAVNLAIKALEQQPCEDTIRKKRIKLLTSKNFNSFLTQIKK